MNLSSTFNNLLGKSIAFQIVNQQNDQLNCKLLRTMYAYIYTNIFFKVKINNKNILNSQNDHHHSNMTYKIKLA